MKVPLILKEVETRTEDSAEREQIAQILEIEENSISKYPASLDVLAVLFQGGFCSSGMGCLVETFIFLR